MQPKEDSVYVACVQACTRTPGHMPVCVGVWVCVLKGLTFSCVLMGRVCACVCFLKRSHFFVPVDGQGVQAHWGGQGVLPQW